MHSGGSLSIFVIHLCNPLKVLTKQLKHQEPPKYAIKSFIVHVTHACKPYTNCNPNEPNATYTKIEIFCITLYTINCTVNMSPLGTTKYAQTSLTHNAKLLCSVVFYPLVICLCQTVTSVTSYALFRSKACLSFLTS